MCNYPSTTKIDQIYFNNISAIFWDFNGTLLDDTHLCIESMNHLLKNRKLSPLDKIRYRDIFTFPVKNYYQEAGFDFNKEPFEKPAMEFIELYARNFHSASLFDDTIEMLDYMNRKGKHQFIVSAMQQSSLNTAANDLGISEYFRDICGISDHYAKGKMVSAKSLIKSHALNPKETCLIGDTLHDYEVAEAIGCQCILIANGHQSRQRLENSGSIVINQLRELKNYF